MVGIVMIEKSFIDQKVTTPKCIYCAKEMVEHHSKTWMGNQWRYIAIVFQCNSEDHQFSIRARTEEEWLEHVKKFGIARFQAIGNMNLSKNAESLIKA